MNNDNNNGSAQCGGGGCAVLPKGLSTALPFPLSLNEKDTSALVIDGRPLRIVVYSRGDR